MKTLEQEWANAKPFESISGPSPLTMLARYLRGGEMFSFEHQRNIQSFVFKTKVITHVVHRLDNNLVIMINQGVRQQKIVTNSMEYDKKLLK